MKKIKKEGLVKRKRIWLGIQYFGIRIYMRTFLVRQKKQGVTFSYLVRDALRFYLTMLPERVVVWEFQDDKGIYLVRERVSEDKNQEKKKENL